MNLERKYEDSVEIEVMDFVTFCKFSEERTLIDCSFRMSGLAEWEPSNEHEQPGGSGATHATRAGAGDRRGDRRHLLCVNTRPILSSAPNQSDMGGGCGGILDTGSRF